MARHHSSKRKHMARHHEPHARMKGDIHYSHNKDRFNDEERHEQDYGSERGFLDKQAMARNEFYAGMKNRHMIEKSDGAMLHEDPRQVANLPQDVQYYGYPKIRGYLPEELDDTLRNVDAQMEYDNTNRAAHYYPKKV